MIHQQTISISTPGREIINITDLIAPVVEQAGQQQGLCQLFIQHTSASLIICENADPTVRSDLENFMTGLVKDGDAAYAHDDEGPDDMPSHIRSILTQTALTIPITDGRLALGTWQGVFLWEHRYAAHNRNILVTVLA